MTGNVFDALGDPTRRELLERLTVTGPVSASRLAADLPITRQAVAKHLAVLEAAGLVDRSRAGRSVEYRLVPGRLDAVESWTDRMQAEWRDRLDRLRRSSER